MKWFVKRRYSDFEWLRKTLQKIFPGQIVPPLPTKKVGNRRFDADFLDRRMNFLQRFINTLCENEYFKSSEALTSFLSATDRIVFDNKMKEFNTYQSAVYIEDIKTFEGKIQIVDDEQNEKYFHNITNYFSIQAQLMDRINNSFKCFHRNMTVACENLEDVEKDFKLLYNLNSKVMMVII